MHQPPAQVVKQSVDSVLADMANQRKHLNDAIDWIGNIRDGVRSLAARGQVEFTNTGFTSPSARQVEIALTLPTQAGVQDVPVFTIVCMFTPKELEALLADPMASLDALQQATHQRWLSAYQTRPFETWMVTERQIWQGGETETVQWLTIQVRKWIEYWFQMTLRAAYRPRKSLEIEYSGKRQGLTVTAPVSRQ